MNQDIITTTDLDKNEVDKIIICIERSGESHCPQKKRGHRAGVLRLSAVALSLTNVRAKYSLFRSQN